MRAYVVYSGSDESKDVLAVATTRDRALKWLKAAVRDENRKNKKYIAMIKKTGVAPDESLKPYRKVRCKDLWRNGTYKLYIESVEFLT